MLNLGGMDARVAETRFQSPAPATLIAKADPSHSVRFFEEYGVEWVPAPQILISGADNFSPDLRRTPEGSFDIPARAVSDPNNLLGWPQLSDAEKRRWLNEINKINERNERRRQKELEIQRQMREKLNQKFLEAQQNRERELLRKQNEEALKARIKQEKIESDQRKRAEQERLKAEKERQKLEAQTKKQQERIAKENQEKPEVEARKKKLEALKQKKEDLKKKRAEAKKLKKKQKSGSDVALIEPKTTTIDFSRSSNNSGQVNQTIDSNTLFELFNKDTINVNLGYNTYEQATVSSVLNIPLKFAWQTQIGQSTFTLETGIDWFSRVPIAPNLKATIESPVKIPAKLGKELLVSAEVDYGPYKFNAETIQNQISYLRLRGSAFLQINAKTTLSSVSYIGVLSDGDQEFQTFNRIERKIGDFSLAGNLFFWKFAQDLSKQSGYFTPSSFLVYNAEVAWEGDVIKPLSCRFSATVGQQIVISKSSNANTLQALCTVPITKSINFDFGYAFSNVFTGGQISDSTAYTNTFTSQLKINW